MKSLISRVLLCVLLLCVMMSSGRADDEILIGAYPASSCAKACLHVCYDDHGGCDPCEAQCASLGLEAANARGKVEKVERARRRAEEAAAKEAREEAERQARQNRKPRPEVVPQPMMAANCIAACDHEMAPTHLTNACEAICRANPEKYIDPSLPFEGTVSSSAPGSVRYTSRNVVTGSYCLNRVPASNLNYTSSGYGSTPCCCQGGVDKPRTEFSGGQQRCLCPEISAAREEACISGIESKGTCGECPDSKKKTFALSAVAFAGVNEYNIYCCSGCQVAPILEDTSFIKGTGMVAPYCSCPK